jgi:hypothetical protein
MNRLLSIPRFRFFVTKLLLAIMCCHVLLFSVPTPAETFTTLGGALDEIASAYKVQVGLEYATNDKDLQPINLDLSAKSIEAVLRQLTNQKPDYSWSLNEGVYDVYPKSRPDSILDVKIHEFSIENAPSKDAAELVGQIPEVKEWLSSRRVTRREFQVGPSVRSSEKLVTLSFKDVTFRTIFNRLIREFGIEDWMVARYGPKQEYIGIYF